ncbi:hypothetical protein NQ317_001497 [Molorchus minor]|uniref:Acyltransferase C-terminal domain-containing protein n=1 Tax=Molorchus minor TaxID=1323400 RepID=A0ABQ9IPW2_9CUCU|nr:hypothetical protein NQ317_001497 [Molorchus minor]
MFPEGTRFTMKKHEASLEFARKVPALYDIELGFKVDAPVKPTMTNMLLGKQLVAHIYMKRILMEEVPKEQAEQETFLRTCLQEKLLTWGQHNFVMEKCLYTACSERACTYSGDAESSSQNKKDVPIEHGLKMLPKKARML